MELIALLPLIFGGTSAAIGITGLYFKHLRKFNSLDILEKGYKDLIDILDSFSKDKKKNNIAQLNKEKEKELIRLLAFGQVIFPHLKKKIIDRLLYIFIPIFLLSIFIVPIDFEGEVIDGLKSLEWIDIGFLLAQLTTSFVPLFVDNLLKPSEREFMRLSSNLYSIYYDRYIHPTILEYNMKSMSGVLKDELSSMEEEDDQIRKIVREELEIIMEKNRTFENLD